MNIDLQDTPSTVMKAIGIGLVAIGGVIFFIGAAAMVSDSQDPNIYTLNATTNAVGFDEMQQPGNETVLLSPNEDVVQLHSKSTTGEDIETRYITVRADDIRVSISSHRALNGDGHTFEAVNADLESVATIEIIGEEGQTQAEQYEEEYWIIDLIGFDFVVSIIAIIGTVVMTIGLLLWRPIPADESSDGE